MGNYAFEVSGMICLGFNSYVDMSGGSNAFFTSMYCPDGINTPETCYPDGSWQSSVTRTQQNEDQSATFYDFYEPSGQTWSATRWRRW